MRFAQRFFNLPPDLGLEQAVATSTVGSATANTTGNVVMYPDDANRFEELMFRGVEIDLMLFEILVRYALFLNACVDSLLCAILRGCESC